MRIQTKLMVLLFSIGAVLLAGGYVYHAFDNQRMYILFRENNEEKSAYFNKLMALKGANLETLAIDYTFWDDTVNFVYNKDMAWAEANLNETTLKTYETDAIWIYQTDLTPVYAVQSAKAARLKDLPFPKEAIPDIFSKQRLCHFFVYTSAGLMEIQGATIHPTLDPERKTPPQGYFFCGRLWDQDYADDLARLIGGNIVLGQAPQVIPDFKTLSKDNTIIFSREFTDWKERPAAYAYVKIHFRELERYKEFSKNTMFVFSGLFVLVILLMAAFLTTALSVPLLIISQALKRGDPVHLRRLEKDTSEFGDISRLIVKFFEQKENLVKEIVDRQKAETRFQQVADAAGEWIWEVDSRGLYTYSSVVVEKTLGYTPREIVGKKYFYDFFLPELREDLKSKALEIFSGGKPFMNFLNQNLHKDGHIVWLETSGSPISDEQGNCIGYRGVDTDVTDRKRAEDGLKEAYIKLKEIQEQLIQAEKLNAVGKLASGVAHEVRNPLAIIVQGIDYLEAKISPKPQDIAEILGILRENINKADGIINDLLDFSRAAHLNLAPADINGILESSLDLVKARFKFDNISVVRETKKDLPLVLADKNKLEQVFINVFLNAIQAMLHGGTITVRTYDKKLEEIRNGIGKRAQDNFYFGERAVLVEIEDTGSGIPEENLRKIFDPFFTTKGQSGSGLGLSVTRNIIHMHRGLIHAESQVGKGTKITVILKLAQRAENI
jgi:PAS domain S-box-containing protein